MCLNNSNEKIVSQKKTQKNPVHCATAAEYTNHIPAEGQECPIYDPKQSYDEAQILDI